MDFCNEAEIKASECVGGSVATSGSHASEACVDSPLDARRLVTRIASNNPKDMSEEKTTEQSKPDTPPGSAPPLRGRRCPYCGDDVIEYSFDYESGLVCENGCATWAPESGVKRSDPRNSQDHSPTKEV